MDRSLADYLALFTSEYQNSTNLMAEISFILPPIIAARQLTESLPYYFDIDNAIGNQLDIVGQWVGQSRFIPVPVSNPWFQFDNVLRGFDIGYWYNPAYSQNDYLSALDDTTYRRLLFAKILANNWNGTIPAADAALNTYFINPSTFVWIDDGSFASSNQNYFTFDDDSGRADGFDQGIWFVPGDTPSGYNKMNMLFTVCVAGQWPNVVDLEILQQELIPIKPGGVAMNVAVTSVNGDALFGFDVENERISGFDTGAWGVSPTYLVNNQLNG